MTYAFILGPYFVVYSGKKRVYKSAVFDIKRGTRCFRMNIPTSDRIVVFGDVKVVFYHKPRRLAKKVRTRSRKAMLCVLMSLYFQQKMFQFYFNTYFVKPVTKMERTNSPFSQHHSDPTPSISSRYSTTRNCFSKDDSYLPSKESDTRQVKTDICCSKLSPSFPFFKNSPFPQRTPHSGQPLNLSVDSNGQEHLATQMSTDRRHSREEAQFVECGNTLDSPTG